MAMEQIAAEAVRRICVKSGLGGGAASNPTELMERCNFPYELVVHEFKSRELKELLPDVRRSRGNSHLAFAFDCACDHAGTNKYNTAMVFVWQGFGGMHVVTVDQNLPYEVGDMGMFWRIGGNTYLLEPIDSFIERLGNADNW